MIRRFGLRRLPLLLAMCIASLVFVAGTRSASAADRAVVVAIQRYPALGSEGNRLTGCVNDGRDVASVLRQLNYHVTLLTDGEATGDRIRQALTAESMPDPAAKTAKLKSGESAQKPLGTFVFYYAGLATRIRDGRNSSPILLASDFAMRSLNAADAGATGSAAIPRNELIAIVAAIPAVSRTVILDCGAGDATAQTGDNVSGDHTTASDEPRVRFLRLEGSDSRKGLDLSGVGADPAPADLGPPKRDSQADHDFTANPSVTLMTASKDGEPAVENGQGLDSHGVFTRILLIGLQPIAAGGRSAAGVPLSLSWGRIFALATLNVAMKTDEQQHPQMWWEPSQNPSSDAALVASNGSNSRSANLQSPADLLRFTHGDSNRIALAVEPDKNDFLVNEPINVTASAGPAGREGFIVLVEQDPEDRLYLLFPRKDTRSSAIGAESARIPVGGVIHLRFAADKPGMERLKAIHVATESEVEAVLALLPEDRGEGISLSEVAGKLPTPAKGLPTDHLFTAEKSIRILPVD